MMVSSVPDQYGTREAPGYASITRGSETALLTRVLGFKSEQLSPTNFNSKVWFWYIPIEKDISFRSVPHRILLHAALDCEDPRSPEMIFGHHRWFLNEIILASGIFSHSIASSGPRSILQVFFQSFRIYFIRSFQKWRSYPCQTNTEPERRRDMLQTLGAQEQLYERAY